jgi:hypothetical protein
MHRDSSRESVAVSVTSCMPSTNSSEHLLLSATLEGSLSVTPLPLTIIKPPLEATASTYTAATAGTGLCSRLD